MRLVEASGIHRGVDPLLRDLAGEHRGGVQVREHGGRRGVRDVVRGDVDGLDGGDGPVLGGGDALLQLAHLGGEGGLVADGGGHAAEQRGDLASRLGEAEDVVHEQEDVHALVAEVLRHGEGGQRHAEARARRLVHLAEHEAGLLQHLRLLHLLPEVVAFPRALPDAGEDRVPAVLRGDVVDELLDDDGLAHARAAEQPRLAAAHVRAEKVDDLDPRLEDLRLGLQLAKGTPGRWMGMRASARHRSLAVHGLSQQVEHPAEHLLADRHGDGGAGVDDGAAAGDAVRGVQRHRAHPVAAEVLLHLAHQARLPAADLRVDQEGVADLGEMPLLELRVEDRPDDLDHGPLAACAHVLPPSLPLMISIISLVICAWRALL